MIKAEKLSSGYNRKIIVDGLDFTVNSGEILTLIGKNGSGKSTVLKTIAKQLPAISGNIYIEKNSLRNMNERSISKTISLLLTEKITAEQMTCEDVVSTGRYPYTGRLGILSETDREVVDNAIQLTSIDYIRERDFRFISDGQRQSVMLARAIAQQPKVMLLDEPTSFLDISHKLRLLTLLRSLVVEKNIAVIQSLHELDLAQKFSDKIICIRNGKAERMGTPEEIFEGDYINHLYDIDIGSYNNLYGTAEPESVKGIPEIFVIGGGGKGIPIYRRLQRQGIPFFAGVIHENDIDFPVAKVLAVECLSEKSFEPISDSSIEKAVAMIEKCKSVICCVEDFGTMNRGNTVLLNIAKSKGILKK